MYPDPDIPKKRSLSLLFEFGKLKTFLKTEFDLHLNKKLKWQAALVPAAYRNSEKSSGSLGKTLDY